MNRTDVYDILGHVFAVRTSITSVRDHLATLLAPFRAAQDPQGAAVTYELSRGGANGFTLARDGTIIQDAARVSSPVNLVLWETHRAAVSQVETGLAVHAGGVSLDGVGVLLPGNPDAGKTTLTASLVASGATYLSDEAPLLSLQSGRLVPYARPLWMDRSSLRLIGGLGERISTARLAMSNGAVHVTAADLDPGAQDAAEVPLGLVVFPTYAPGGGGRLTPVARADALIRILGNTFNSDRFDRGQLVSRVGDALSRATCVELTVDDLGEAVGRIAQLARRTPRVPVGSN